MNLRNSRCPAILKVAAKYYIPIPIMAKRRNTEVERQILAIQAIRAPYTASRVNQR